MSNSGSITPSSKAGDLWLDHPGHKVGNLNAACTRLERLGFALTPVSKQYGPAVGGVRKPTGMANRCIMFQRSYVEISGPSPDAGEVTVAPQKPSVHILALGTPDPAFQAEKLPGRGIPDAALMKIEREIGTPDGEGLAKFEVVGTSYQVAPATRMLMVRHGTPDLIWQPRWLAHPNGATELTEVLFVSDDLLADRDNMLNYTAVEPASAPGGSCFELARGRISILAGESAGRKIGYETASPGLVGYVIQVPSIEAVRSFLAEEDAPSLREGSGWISLNETETVGGILFFAEQDAELPWH